MLKAELMKHIQTCAKNNGLDVTLTTVGEMFNVIMDAVTSALVAGSEVTLDGIGSFKVVDKPARTARNPKTGETVQVPAKRVPKFKMSAVLKREVKG